MSTGTKREKKVTTPVHTQTTTKPKAKAQEQALESLLSERLVPKMARLPKVPRLPRNLDNDPDVDKYIESLDYYNLCVEHNTELQRNAGRTFRDLLEECATKVEQVISNIIGGDSHYRIDEAHLFCPWSDNQGPAVAKGVKIAALAGTNRKWKNASELATEAGRIWQTLAEGDEAQPGELLLEACEGHQVVHTAIKDLVAAGVKRGIVPRRDSKRLEELYRIWTHGIKVEDLRMTPLNRPSLGSWMGYPTELINLDGRSISRNITDKNVAASVLLVPLASLVENPTLLKHFVLLYKDGKAVPNVKELAMQTFRNELGHLTRG